MEILIELFFARPIFSMVQAAVFLCAEPKSSGERKLQFVTGVFFVASIIAAGLLATSFWLDWAWMSRGILLLCAVICAIAAGLVAGMLERAIRIGNQPASEGGTDRT